jgi:hypothetical protein
MKRRQARPPFFLVFLGELPRESLSGGLKRSAALSARSRAEKRQLAQRFRK